MPGHSAESLPDEGVKPLRICFSSGRRFVGHGLLFSKLERVPGKEDRAGK
jgi:hypothetical protein